jgi:hypothetical protein
MRPSCLDCFFQELICLFLLVLIQFDSLIHFSKPHFHRVYLVYLNQPSYSWIKSLVLSLFSREPVPNKIITSLAPLLKKKILLSSVQSALISTTGRTGCSTSVLVEHWWAVVLWGAHSLNNLVMLNVIDPSSLRFFLRGCPLDKPYTRRRV